MPASTYVEDHWFTGKPKLRCGMCKRVVFTSQEEAEMRAALISERTPGFKAILGKRCGHWHVSGPRRKRRY